MGINAIEQNYPYLGLGQLGGVTSGTRARQVQGTSYGVNGGEPTNRQQTDSGLVGINTNLGIGSEISGQTQAGHKLGGRTLAFA